VHGYFNIFFIAIGYLAENIASGRIYIVYKLSAQGANEVTTDVVFEVVRDGKIQWLV
jgi:hypothetical protein